MLARSSRCRRERTCSPDFSRRSCDSDTTESWRAISERDAAVSRAAFVFVPLRPSSGEEGVEAPAHAADLAAEVTASDVADIDRAVEQEWLEALGRLPSGLRDAVDPELREAVLQDRYYSILEGPGSSGSPGAVGGFGLPASAGGGRSRLRVRGAPSMIFCSRS